VGKLVLNENPQNYFAEIEQVTKKNHSVFAFFHGVDVKNLPRLPSPHRISFQASKLLPTPSSNLVSSHTPTRTATVSV
jgi:hypothetical protein